MADHDDSPRSTDAPTGFTANRRDVLRTATGLAAAAVVGGTLLDKPRVALAANASIGITGQLDGLGQFSIQAFSWGLSNPATIGSTTGGAGAGKVHLQDLSLTKVIDALTPQIFVAIASGQIIPSGTITCADNKGNLILRLDLTQILLTSMTLGESAGATAPTENLSLAFGKIVLTVGDSSGGWDVTTNTNV